MAGRVGNEAEKLAKQILESRGYMVHKTIHASWNHARGAISQNNDIFGCIDLIAKKHGERTRWIQVTASGGIGQKIADLSEIPWDRRYDSVEVWLWKGRKMDKVKAAPGKKREKWKSYRYFQVRHFDDQYVLDREHERRVYDPAVIPDD